MKLSEAMREGSRNTEQITSKYIRVNEGAVCTCALGAALLAIYPENELVSKSDFCVYGTLEKNFPYIDDVYERIIEMNDKEGQTREQIADWLESIGY